MRLRRRESEADATVAALDDVLAHYRGAMSRYADALDHVLALGGALHAAGECETCDWIRVRPACAFSSTEEAAEHLALLRLPRKEIRPRA